MVIIDTCMHLSSHDTDAYPPCGDAVPYFRDGHPDPRGDASPSHLRQCMNAQAVPVDRAFNFCNGWYGWDNRLAMDLLEGNDDWLACGVLLDPASPASPDELRRLVAGGASGLRIQPSVTGRPLADPAATPLWQVAAELGIAVDVNLAQHEYEQVAQRAREFPSVPIVLDHCGWLVGFDPETLTVDIPCALAIYPNVFIQLPAMQFVWTHLQRPTFLVD
jgi:L-fuconolactonase